MPFSFQLDAQDPATGARAGRFVTRHGEVLTPAFLPVGTAGSVKSLAPDDLSAAGCDILLCNTYHLMLRPGSATVRHMGGLHRFMGWDGALLTDSGGFQVMSLTELNRVHEEGVEFRSHLDGALEFLTPERVMDVQADLGSDIAVTLDHAVPLPVEAAAQRDAGERTLRWTERSLRHARGLETPSGMKQLLFGIVQGGGDPELRREMAERTACMACDGFAIGGLSVGETKEETWALARATAEALPADLPRYLMGMGTPLDLLDGIACGIDLFDCVLPTRNARNGMAFTSEGPVNIRNAEHARSDRPLDPSCGCEACATFTRAYLRHLHLAQEILAHRMLTLHNVTFYQTLMAAARRAIERGDLSAYAREFSARYRERGGDPPAPP